MIKREVLAKISTLFKTYPAIAILGSRQVGKTTLAKTIARGLKKKSIYFDLENDKDYYMFLNDAQSVLEDNIDNLVIIDEIQRIPHLFTLLRSMIDLKRKPARYLLLGSASPDLIKGVSESLAGRISYVDLYPINLSEALVKKISLKKHWFRGGYPDALLAKSDDVAMQWVKDYVKSYVERDLAHIYDLQLPSSKINVFWKMLSTSNGSVWNSESYGRALGITGPTVNKYLDLLVGAFLVYKLQPWFVNVKKRVLKSPKVYIADTGILHQHNNLTNFTDLTLNVQIGASWEGYVVMQVMQHLPKGIDLYYYRTHHGAECDLVFVKGVKPIAVAEIKYSLTPTLSKGFYECIDDLKTKNNFVLIPSEDSYKGKEGVNICGLIPFITNINKLLQP